MRCRFLLKTALQNVVHIGSGCFRQGANLHSTCCDSYNYTRSGSSLSSFAVVYIGKTYVWLDIFSIPEFHDGCKLLAVNSLCYAAAADDLIILHGLLSCSLLSWFAVICMGKTYVWLGIFSIPQFHDGCKLLAVRPFYVYAAAAAGLINVAWISELFIADIV